MLEDNGKIIFTTEDNEEVEFYVLEQTMISGVNYILVADSAEDDEANALILKDISNSEDEDAIYDIVTEEKELTAISKIFVELMDDIDIEME